MSKLRVLSLVISSCAALLGPVAPALAQDDAGLGFERTPPRLSFTDGEVSFLRPGAEDWTPALVNTALAAGDELYTAQSANLELQIGARAFVRAGENTQLGLTSLEPDFLQLRLTSGHLSLDLRSLKSGQTFEIDTPNAAFTVERSGYYRIEVDGETTTFASRRGGRATVTPASGDSAVIAASEQVVVTGADAPQIASYAAPELDAWDRWNYARTDDQLDAVSARYVPSGVYGADDLDQHGDWRVVPSYGAVWVPRGVAAGWAPYSTGRWIYDPYYSWTWVDSAPWGWAPYHYGRWVRVSNYWGWCPGPVVARPYYSPALVAFYGGGGYALGIPYGRPRVGWVALGWGEPIVRWWGPARYRGNPHWAGWGGPRVVNKVVIKHKTVYKGDQINVYQNADVRDAIVGVDRNHFGRRSAQGERYARMRTDELTPLRGDFDVKPDRSSLVAEQRSAQRPPRDTWKRSVVATREPRIDATPALETRSSERTKPGRGATSRGSSGAPDAAPAARVVQPPREGKRSEATQRPPFGTQSDAERRMPQPAPRFERSERSERASRSAPPSEPSRAARPERQRMARPEAAAAPAAPQPDAPARSRTRSEATPRPDVQTRAGARSEAAPRNESARPDRNRSASRREQSAPAARDLPGEPANRVYRARETQERPVARESQRTARPQASEASRGGHERQGGGRESAGDSGANAHGGWSRR